MEQSYIKRAWSVKSVLLNHIPEMNQVEELLYQTVAADKGTVGEMCTYLLESGGKRLRPLLTVLSGKALSPSPPKELTVAGAAVELIHMASLIHDDIIDQSLYRRGQPTIHSLWGQKNAVLAGDFLFAKAFDLLVSHRLFPVLKLMVAAIQEMCRGEITQSDYLFNTNQSGEDYFLRIEQKTGKLLSACCQSGAIIAGSNPEEETALKNYGTYLGYTYQIVDDLLDFSGNRENLGKPVCQDLAQGNLTLPVLYLMEHPEEGPWVRKIIENKDLNPAHCATIINLVQQTGLLEASQKTAVQCGENAKKELRKIPPGVYRNLLEEIVDKALNRTS
jgi:heptaprenyl diphosphate synthase